jgi:hypothetical protein
MHRLRTANPAHAHEDLSVALFISAQFISTHAHAQSQSVTILGDFRQAQHAHDVRSSAERKRLGKFAVADCGDDVIIRIRRTTAYLRSADAVASIGRFLFTSGSFTA